MPISKAGLALTIVLLSACSATGPKEHFMEDGIRSAAFDLECEARSLRVDDLGSGMMGVEGCGKRARYVYVPGTGWVQN